MDVSKIYMSYYPFFELITAQLLPSNSRSSIRDLDWVINGFQNIENKIWIPESELIAYMRRNHD